MHLRSSSLRLRKVRQTEVEALEAPGPATPSSCCSFTQLEARNAIQPRRRLGISFFQTKGQETTSCQHASVRLSSTCCRQNRNRRPPRAFGFHTFRRTLASVLVANNYDPKLVQELLRHSNIKTTLDVYAQAITPAKLEAQGMFLTELLKGTWTEKEPEAKLVMYAGDYHHSV